MQYRRCKRSVNWRLKRPFEDALKYEYSLDHIFLKKNIPIVEYTSLFRQLTDHTRLRTLLLLRQGPLCVCHIVEILGEPQAKISKQLSQLRRAGLLKVERVRNWSVYRITEPPMPVLEAIIEVIRSENRQGPIREDERKRRQLIERLQKDPGCCPLPFEVACK